MRPRTWLVAALLFGSGFCALVYQIGWLRDFRLIFGSSTSASAAVLAIFIGGLGAGGLLLGPRADRHPRPLLFYAQIELIVALSAAATPFLLDLVRFLYIASGGSSQLGTLVATTGRVVLSAIVLGVPTLAMGGTLPAAARAATRDTDVGRRDVAALYALNTLGAVVGCLAATFWLLVTFGTRSTLWLAAGVNLVIAVTAWAVDRSLFSPLPGAGTEPIAPAVRHNGGKKKKATPTPSTPAPSTSTPGTSAPLWFLLIASGAVGFAFFLMELVWYRLLAPLLGGSVFTFGLVLAVALAGIGLGGLLYALRTADRPASLSGFVWTCLIEATAIAATFALGDRVAVLAVTLLPLASAGFASQIAGWSVVTLVVVLPPAIVAGYQFPLLIALFGRARDDVGRQIGLAYAANTCGAIVGSLAGGFGLLPWLSATGAWQLVPALLVLLGSAAVVIDKDVGGRRPMFRLVGELAVAGATIAFLLATGPTATWRHSGIGARRAGPARVLATPNRFREWGMAERHSIVWEGDGTESGVALAQNDAGYAFVVNGKTDGSARSDAGTQVMSGLIGALASPEARRALVIGLGTGSTAGWLGVVPTIDRVDVVELEPLILEVARACAPVNQNVLGNEKVQITIGDARETLLTSRDRYDIIASEPSNPYRAGVASLFTLEYYRAANDRLTDTGVFVQWVQGYEIDAETLRTVYATLGTVFPHIETWYTSPGDLILVASKRPRTYRAADLAKRIAEEPFKSALNQAWRTTDIHGLLAHYLANESLARAVAAMPGVQINTDDRNIVEFGLARTVGITSAMVAEVRNAARATGAGRPTLTEDNGIRWPEVDTAWTSYNASQGSFADVRYQGPDNEQARQAAVVEYYRNNDLERARAYWEQQQDPARDPTEMAMLADIAAATASDLALPFINRLRAYRPGETDALLATLRLQQLRLPEAAAAVEAALVRFRTDPWSMQRYMERAVQIAQILVSRDRTLARRMFDALGQPFAVHAIEDRRLVALAELTRQVDFRGLCGAAVSALGPDVPWTESFLRLRLDCYQATSSPRAAAAARDLDEFLVNQPQPLIKP
ncbi:MAG: hypothetical protein A3G76_00970 [Acidobacteria bacterium RIFCSPLOWO2_12_FULL_65_11]|nr:MAG: hypothetical protein A3H95_16230 [Acidobacteria bacterium RIFCSPLOWO2_02_FULL_64_15]OFW33382.1 MAG: hypothetical protein A3G76_00970 [Acidobacteria bacterium RIFCSPLOWO2_12_FULL_65_11]